jgi:hypothetical protein
MPTYSGNGGDRNPLASCSGCESLDALSKEMFQAPGLLELERTLERHPHYPLLKIKEQMARRPAFLLGPGGDCLESLDGFRDLALPAPPGDGDDRRDRPVRPQGTKSRLWGGNRLGGHQTSAACQKRSLGGKAAGGKKRRKQEVTQEEAAEKLRAKENAIIVRMTKARRTEGETEQELIEKLYSLYDYEHATACGYTKHAAKTFQRTGEYKSWARYRKRGNAARLDPNNAASELNSNGGQSSKSGATRNDEFAAKNGLRIGREAKLQPLDAQARQAIENDQEAKAWYAQNGSKLDELIDAEESTD